MSTSATIAKHPIRRMLEALPVGLLVFSFLCDLVYLFSSRPSLWSDLAVYSMGGGIIGAILAIVPEFVDFLSIKEPKMRSIARQHMLVNVAVLSIFIVDFWFRVRTPIPTGLPILLSLMAVILFSMNGWWGSLMAH